MILLLGGTSETAPLALALADGGVNVLVSTASTVPLELPTHPRIRRRCGPLDVAALIELARHERAGVIVDATHPYATAAHATAQDAAKQLCIPCLRYDRPSGEVSGEFVVAESHDEAARLAAAVGGAILLTTGSRNLAPYVKEARRAGRPLIARVLPEKDSLDACRNAGVSDACIIAARGPFNVAQNREVIRTFAIKVLVTKESGAAGGLAEKIEAAKLENCRVVIVARPQTSGADCFSSIPELVRAVRQGQL
ncbi:MAG TPA: precorrin-6A reductase [Planctomycetota bacterium]|jgi:precorrin-6A/cobalt-precorrin-6A reductase